MATYPLPCPHESIFSILWPDFWLGTLNLLVLVENTSRLLHRLRAKDGPCTPIRIPAVSWWDLHGRC